MDRTRRIVLLGATALAAGGGAWAWLGNEANADMVVYKSPTCGCCGDWVEHVRNGGLTVAVKLVEDVSPIKARLGVPDALESCHTAVIGDYVIEGHVPMREIRRLLAERPAARGLAVPGMPLGSPGMEQGGERERYAVVLFGEQGQSVYARY